MDLDFFLYVDLICFAAGILLFARIRLVAASPTINLNAHYPVISIIIPARNEENNLPYLLGSLASQGLTPAEILLVDDASYDNTARVARDGGARVITSLPLPPGWVGKTWACYQGAQQARGELFIFLDADTTLEPGGLQKIADEAAARRAVISIYPYHRVRQWYEELSAFFNCSIIASSQGKRLFGPALVITKRDYFAVGGHERVKDKILEDYYLSEIFTQEHIPIISFVGKGVLSFRMYPGGFKDLTQGWSKAFASGTSKTPVGIVLMIGLWIFGCADTVRLLWMSIGAGSLVHAAAASTLYVLFAAQLYWVLRRIGSFRPLTAVCYPIPLIYYTAVFIYSAFLSISKRGVVWKSRKVNPSGSA